MASGSRTPSPPPERSFVQKLIISHESLAGLKSFLKEANDWPDEPKSHPKEAAKEMVETEKRGDGMIMRTSRKVNVENLCKQVQGADREFEALPEYLKRCFLYCSLFPVDYKFEKDTLVQLWIAEGFIEAEGTKRMEDTGSVYFDELLYRKFVVPSGLDFKNILQYKLGHAGTYKLGHAGTYKLGHAGTSYLEKAFSISKLSYLRAEGQKLSYASGLEDLPEYLKRCFFYCSQFPVDYEFEKDTLVQLWIAEGFIEAEGTKRMEDTGSVYFDELLSKKFIATSRFDFKNNLKYKLGLAGTSYIEKVFSKDQKLSYASGLTVHLSLLCKDIDHMTFEILRKCEHLRTLLLLKDYGSSVKEIPRNFFLDLSLLRTLDLSLTHISELPSSIAKMKSLRYLDVSETPIIRLPETVDCLFNLQTLKLRRCLGLVALPKNMNKLTNLRHLYIDNFLQLSMPKGMGNLTSLQTLRTFLVGIEDGYRIVELKHMNDLSGAFCISSLENILNFEEAEEAALSNKKYLDKLELQWSDLHNEKAAVEKQEEVLEVLQPHKGLKELEILFYSGSKLPSWINNPSFADLASISLFSCTNCHRLPLIGELPSLKFLYIFDMNMVKEIDRQFCKSDRTRGHQAFPKLEKLAMEVMLNLEEWIGVQKGDFPCLLKLALEYCPKLVALPPLSFIKSLKHLEINDCPKILSLPKEGLPSSVEFVVITSCPALKVRCCKGKGEDWVKIAHVPSFWIDDQEISGKSRRSRW